VKVSLKSGSHAENCSGPPDGRDSGWTGCRTGSQ
jgi:hypothetical protein